MKLCLCISGLESMNKRERERDDTFCMMVED